jgi:ABC-type branched-subunit amino acid transport system ATPase component
LNHAIAVENLVKRYGGVQAVDGLSFQVDSGTTCALLGGNGAGKTTTLALLLEGAFKWDLFGGAVALNAVYLCAGAAIFSVAFRDARRRGALLQMGE